VQGGRIPRVSGAGCILFPVGCSLFPAVYV
jgi:hypothetical protein